MEHISFFHRSFILLLITLIFASYGCGRNIQDPEVRKAIEWIEAHIPEVKEITNKGGTWTDVLRKVIEELQTNPELKNIMANSNPNLWSQWFGNDFQMAINQNRNLVKTIVESIEEVVPEATKIMETDQEYMKVATKVVKQLEKSETFIKMKAFEAVNSAIPEAFDTGSAFACEVERSPSIPTSVHKLRPSDIDVIATIGDSLSAGMGIYSRTLLTLFTQYRGHSFTMGGSEDISKHTTLPTVLKKFNPRLFGYSTGISGPDGINAGFNEAVVGNRAEHMPNQARLVVAKMQKSRDIDFQNDWKVINLFIGGNDICDFCKDEQRFSPDNYEKHIREALTYFYDNVPRAFVNLVEILDASPVAKLQQHSLACRALLSTFWCRCGVSQPKEKVSAYALELQKRVQKIAEDPKWLQKEDFTVVLQPFLRETEPPTKSNGEIDMSFFAPDCFHFSARGHALGGRSLWNNMLETVGSKRTNWAQHTKVNCPTNERPYLATKKN